jgi:uroporphyrin-III C-methyltransferase
MSGKVWLVGAGPGDPELLTLRAFKALQSADVVLHDELVSPDVLALIPGTTQVHNVGKRCGRKRIQQHEIHTLLVNFARFGLRVVRLKSGDPLIFGRAGEEMEALREAGVEFEVVPGVTSALGAAASAQISLTHRGVAPGVAFLTGQHANHAAPAEWKAWVEARATLVIYMPGHEYGQLTRRLMDAGMCGGTPCVVVSRAASKDEQILRSTIRDLAAAEPLPAPALVFVGEAPGSRTGRAINDAWRTESPVPPPVVDPAPLLNTQGASEG